MRDLPLNPKLIGDQIPVDFVSNQLLAAIPICCMRAKRLPRDSSILGEELSLRNLPILVTHCCSSSQNGVSWGDCISSLQSYWSIDSYDKALFTPKLTAHPNEKSYKLAFKLKSDLPSRKLVFLTSIFGTKKSKKSVGELRHYVEQCRQIGEQFAYFMNNEWIFDNGVTLELKRELDQVFSDSDLLNFDVGKIKWKPYIQNHAYGIKRFVLKEEAYLPSEGFVDARVIMNNPMLPSFTSPISRNAFYKKVLSYSKTKKIVMSSDLVRTEIEKEVRKKLATFSKSLDDSPALLSKEEVKIRNEVDKRSDQILRRIYSAFDMSSLRKTLQGTLPIFKKTFKKIVVNEIQLQNLKEMFSQRRGPIIFCPTHRSYADFLILSSILYLYGLEVPLICAGEDFLGMPFVGDLLGRSGAFFMRRSFKDDPLYKAIFYEYVGQLNRERQIMEFFIEGTRSRTNKILPPKYGFLSVCTRTFFNKEVEDITFVPCTINYSRTLEGESFPGELMGGKKVPESVSRILSGTYNLLNTNLGTLKLDFCEPYTLSKFTQQFSASQGAGFDPFTNKTHQQLVNSAISHEIVFKLQKNLRMMPTTLVAAILLLYRKGISKDELEQKVSWLAMIINERGANFCNDYGLPGKNTIDIGLDLLDSYIVE
mmetsp:Transcript_12191/g.20541  ORF Transcript_12191/g.20541 Transcript_12191/m.20541 type:complete len:650 (+) Transcript_12191:758-2707(+)